MRTYLWGAAAAIAMIAASPGAMADMAAAEKWVDEEFQPLSASAIQSAVNGKAPNPALAVAKRMPIRMRLLIDQRNLDDLLIACANSALIVEVRQVRFNPESSTDRKADDESFERTIELYGIIYIYNPVDTVLLGSNSSNT